MKYLIIIIIFISVYTAKGQSDFIQSEFNAYDSIHVDKPQQFISTIGPIIDLISKLITPGAEDEYKPILQMKAEKERIKLFKEINRSYKKGHISQLQFDFENGALMGINVKDAKVLREFYQSYQSRDANN